MTLRTSDGLALEGDLRVPDGARAGVVITHPHPSYGGSRTTAVPAALFDALPDAGIAALRFDFRGVGRSEGSYGGGGPERADVVAALDHLAGLGLRVALAGWSFGADVALSVADERVAGWFAVAAPLRFTSEALATVAADGRPKHLAVPEHDQFAPPAVVRTAVEAWTATTVEVVTMTDHSLAGRLPRVAELALAFVDEVLSPPRP